MVFPRTTLWTAVLLLATAGAAAEEPRSLDPRAGNVVPALTLNGDVRIRYEGNSERDGGPEPHRGVLRMRLGARYAVNEMFTVGARVVTGDPGNPRTADVTMGDFLDDLELSLDRAHVEMRRGRFFATAGKFSNPFSTSELVWDGDVNPGGVAASMELGSPGRGLSSRVTGIFMLLDESGIASDSTMWGAQFVLARSGGRRFGIEVAAGYWDYRITGLEHADDSGDLRGNALTADRSAYLSDFDLADLKLTLRFPGPSAEYPIRVVADVVKNLGAAVDEDQGFAIDVALGTAWVRDRFELGYGYARCEAEAVLGAFSHDNIPLATNYRNHSLRVSYGLMPDTMLCLTWYYFSRLHSGPNVADQAQGEYSSRARLDLMLRF